MEFIELLLPEPPDNVWQDKEMRFCQIAPVVDGVEEIKPNRLYFRARSCPVCAGPAADVWVPAVDDVGHEFVQCAGACTDDEIDRALASQALYESAR
jgi:hypothetical protein